MRGAISDSLTSNKWEKKLGVGIQECIRRLSERVSPASNEVGAADEEKWV